MEDERAGAILWQGRWLIAVSLVFSVAVAVLATEVQTKIYEGSALLQASGARDARTSATLIADRGFLTRIRSQVEHGQYTANELADRVHARPVAGTALVRVTAEESSPALALALVRDVAAAAVGSLHGVELAAPASASRSAIRPKTFQNVLAGIALGLLLGVLLSWLRVRLDRSLHGADEIEELTGAPVLATEEALDALFAQLGPQRVVAVVDLSPGDGRTVAGEGLGRAAARAGVRVGTSLSDADGALLVADVGATTRADLAAAATAVRETGPPLLGVVVSRPHAREDAVPVAAADGEAPSYDTLVRD